MNRDHALQNIQMVIDKFVGTKQDHIVLEKSIKKIINELNQKTIKTDSIMQNLKYTDENGIDQNVTVDLSNGVEITGIEPLQEWDLRLRTVTATEMTTYTHIGSRKKRE